MLKVSLAEDPTALRIADWLKTHAPKGVTAVSVEALILKARKLQGLVDQTAFPPGSIFSKLPQVARSELLHQLQGLNTAIQAADDSAKNSTVHKGNSVIAKSIDAIDTSVAGVCKAVETPLLLDPQFSHGGGLYQANDDDGVVAIGAEDAFSLRRHLLGVSAIPEGLKISRNLLNLKYSSRDRFRSGKLKDKVILVESFPYQSYEEDDKDDNRSRYDVGSTIERMAAQLCQPKKEGFHILPCAGYINEPVHETFGFVFEPPPVYTTNLKPTTLRELYGMQRIIPLGDRFRLSYELVVALENFHRVGWVHKNFTSYNIVFFPPHSLSANPQAPSPVNNIEDCLTSPWIFGFDTARPEDAHSHQREDYSLSNNVYQHASRWGKPELKFAKFHDVYSLVSLVSFFHNRKKVSNLNLSRELCFWRSHTGRISCQS